MDRTLYTPIERLEKFKENKDAIIIAVQVSYKNDTKDDIHQALIELAKETSSGTWVDITTKTEESNQADAWIIHEKGNIGYIGIPAHNWDISGGFNNVWANIGGNYFGLHVLKKALFLDVYFPPAIVRQFPGPRFGVDGVYKLFGNMKRMIAGSIVKPKMGLNPVDWAKVAEQVFWEADLVKDDENLCNQTFCPWKERFTEVMTRQQKIAEKTGNPKMYAHNITTRNIVGRAREVQELAEDLGTPGFSFMIDGVIAGLNAVHDVRDQADLKHPIYIHRAMHGAMTRGKEFGMTFLVWAKMFRMAGADYLHTGTYGSGKMGEREEFQESLAKDEEPEEMPIEWLDSTMYLNRWLTKRWEHLKPVLPMASGGLFPGALPRIRRFNGAIGNSYKIGCNAGGGIHGHPDGTRAGAKAFEEVAGIVETKEYQSLQTEKERVDYLVAYAARPGKEYLKWAFDRKEWGILV
ncbi:MAG: RuBisCO large subunit C-terminal-like domain-containing protein [Candidatus Sigynarchaeum springense]